MRQYILQARKEVIIIDSEFDSRIWNNGNVLDAVTYTANPLEYMQKHLEDGTRLAEKLEYSSAIKTFQQAVDTITERARYINPHARFSDVEGIFVAHLRNNIGYCLLQEGYTKEAIKVLKSAAKIKPDIAFIHNNLADVYRKLGKAKKAIKHYEKELQINPEHPTAAQSLEELSKILQM